VEVALRKLEERSKLLRIAEWVNLLIETRKIRITKNQSALNEIAKLDGCYVLKTDLSPQAADKELLHERYKDLTQIEWAFRKSKTVHLEMRPIYVRREAHTRGHALVVMLAYRIIKELAVRWQSLDLTVEEGLDQLDTLCLIETRIKGQAPYQKVPIPRDSNQQLLKLAHVKLPHVLPSRGVNVTTKAKLPDQRKNS
jgi:hypothetical protein